MATPNLPPSLSTRNLHPLFARLLDGFVAAQTSQTTRLFPDAPVYCEYEMPEFGGEKCARVAAVHHLDLNLPCCLRHFEAVNRG